MSSRDTALGPVGAMGALLRAARHGNFDSNSGGHSFGNFLDWVDGQPARQAAVGTNLEEVTQLRRKYAAHGLSRCVRFCQAGKLKAITNGLGGCLHAFDTYKFTAEELPNITRQLLCELTDMYALQQLCEWRVQLLTKEARMPTTWTPTCLEYEPKSETYRDVICALQANILKNP